MGDDVEIGGGLEPGQEIPAQVGAVEIDDHRFDVVHVEAQGISEKKDEEKR